MSDMENEAVPRTLAQLITERRAALGQSNDDELIALTGRNQTTVSGWRNGKWPGTDVLDVVAEWLGISYDELMAVRVAEQVAKGRRVKQPRGPVVAAPEIPEEVARRLDDFERRLSALEQPDDVRPPRSGRAEPRKPSPK